MENIYDFNKVVEQKQVRLENKKKHIPISLKEEVGKVLGDLGLNQEFTEEYKNLVSKYLDLGNEFKKLTDLTLKASVNLEKSAYLYGLVEHFITKNELENQFIDFLKDVAENESVEEYRDAARKQVDFYHYEHEGEEFYMIDDEYGWMKEDEELNAKVEGGIQ